MQVKLKKAKETRHNPEKQEREKKTPVSPQGQEKRRETSFVARKFYYNPKLLSFLEALDLYTRDQGLKCLFK
jgi:hypothetical protein